jgi:hypothetical protein
MFVENVHRFADVRSPDASCRRVNSCDIAGFKVCFVPVLSTAVSIIQQLSILFSKTLIRNKASR